MGILIFYIIAIFITSLGLSYIIIYLNVLSVGLNIFEYLIFILTRKECWLFFVGLSSIFLVTFKNKIKLCIKNKFK